VAEGRVSARFHETLVEATATVVERLWQSQGPLPVALTGGVFQNALLCAGVESRLSKEISVLRHREVPPGDGGIALGQALIADAISRDKD
jgi:hydrogenase maturation protein HypF